MPIARELRHFYRTESWYSLLEVLKKRSGNRCEWCDKPGGRLIWTRTGGGLMFWRLARESRTGGDLTWRNREGFVVTFENRPEWDAMMRLRLRQIRVVLCGAHLNHQAGDDRPENAALLCQWHHLHQDEPHHRETRKRHKDEKRPLLSDQLEGLRAFTNAVRKFAEGA